MKYAVTILSLVWMAGLSFAHEMRMWTAMNGSKQEAAFVRYEYPNVFLQRRDGQIIKIHRDQLCDDDWLYVYDRDPSIMTFWIKLGEVVARQVNVRNGGGDVALYYNPPVWGKNLRDPEWIAIKKVAESAGSKMEFFISNNGRCLIRYKDWSANILLPNDQTLFFSPPKVTHEEGGKNTASIGYRLVDNTLRKYTWDFYRCSYERYHKIEKLDSEYLQTAYWMTIWSDHRNNAFHETFHVLAINASKPGIRYGNQILDICAEQFKRNIEDGTDVQYFVFDERSGKELEKMAAETKRIVSKFHGISRYDRMVDLINKREHGLPNSASTPSSRMEHVKGTGSGFFISDSGFFLTNHHVVEGGRKIELMTETGIVPAKVVRIDPDVDLALLQAKPDRYASLPFIKSSEARLGTDIFTIGFPMPDLQGFSPKMTRGVISSLKGLHDDDKEYQIDAAIQPGNSGGPLVNNNGEIVGVIVASLNSSLVQRKKGRLPQNVNYAVKKKHVMDFLSQVPKCASLVKTSQLPDTGKSADSSVIENVQKSCAMVIVYE